MICVVPLQVNRLREVLLVLPDTYADFDSLRRSFTQHVLLQNMENCEVLKQVNCMWMAVAACRWL